MPKKNKARFKSLLVGATRAGKSNIFSRLRDNTLPLSDEPTTAYDFFIKKQTLHDCKTIDLDLWEIAGSERLQIALAPFYSGAENIILCVDLSGNPENLLHEVTFFLKKINIIAPKGVPVFIVGTKADKTEESAENISKNKKNLVNFSVTPDSVCFDGSTNIQGVYITSARFPDNANYNQRIDKSIEMDISIQTFDAVMSDIIETTYRKKLMQDQSDSEALEKSEPIILDNAAQEKNITVSIVRELIKKNYITTSFFRYFNKNHKDSHIEKLERLLNRKKDNDLVREDEIVGCLGGRGCFFSKQRDIENHIKNDTNPRSGTGKVFKEVYKLMQP